MNKGAIIVLVAILAVLLSTELKEKYRPRQADYRYGFVDTNPARRTSQFFDTCSPENFGDCPLNNPYEGLPLP